MTTVCSSSLPLALHLPLVSSCELCSSPGGLGVLLAQHNHRPPALLHACKDLVGDRIPNLEVPGVHAAPGQHQAQQ